MNPKRSSTGQANLSVTRSDLRRIIKRLFLTSDDFDAFCLDQFEQIYRRFSRGMDQLSRVNLLLELEDPRVILECINEYNKAEESFAKAGEQILEANNDAKMISFLRNKLDRLYIEKDNARRNGLSTKDFDREIVKIKKAQRKHPSLQEGEILAEKYRLIEVVGRGGFAKVWQGFDRITQQLVAIKILHSDQSDNHGCVERFLRGARQMKSLTHPAIVRVLDGPFEYEGFYCLAMEYLSGGSLSKAIKSKSLYRADALKIIIDIGYALSYAHGRGLVHRDVKPDNILFDNYYNARLTDFDLVMAQDTTGGTRTGSMGTFIYAAPEQLEDAKNVDHRADIYSLGMCAVFTIYGSQLPGRAFQSASPFIRSLDCSSGLKKIINRAVGWEPESRYQDIREFCSDLEYLISRDGIFAEPSQSVVAIQQPVSASVIASLRLIYNQQLGIVSDKVFPLSVGRSVIGYDTSGITNVSADDVLINDTNMSAMHFSIDIQENPYHAMIADLASPNVTFVNGMRIFQAPKWHTLKDGDVIRAGNDFFIFRLSKQLHAIATDSGSLLTGISSHMSDIRTLIQQLAGLDAPVLILGETGTGKELIARELHQRSGRQGPMIALNSSAIPTSLAASALFGHEAGAFSGAREHIGLFEAANMGTLFLDEIADAALEMQAMLPRVLDNKSFFRLGGSRSIHVDVRVIGATVTDLELAVRKGHFRQDLYDQFSGLMIRMKPLRERKEDILVTLERYLTRASEVLTPNLVDALLNFSWRGNTRELINVANHIKAIGATDGIFELLHAPKDLYLKDAPRPSIMQISGLSKEGLISILDEYHGSLGRAAELLGMSRMTLRRWVTRYDIDLEKFRRN